MTVEPQGGPSAAQRAYQVIRDGILEGSIAPGTMLGEAPLALSLSVSRTPVRAALVRLQEEGWITIYPKRGALVRGLGDRQVAELADARLILESAAVQRASAESRRILADKLEISLQAQREAFAREDLPRFIDLTLEFHRNFVEVGGSSVLVELYERLADRHRFALFQSGERMLARSPEVIEEHERLLSCLRDGDARQFEAVLAEHISDNGGTIHDPLGGASTA